MHRLAIQLKLALEASGYTRSEICDRCEIETAALSKYLNGKMHPRKNVFTRLIRIVPDEYLGAVYTAYLLDNLPEGGEAYLTISENSLGSPSTTKEPRLDYNAGPPLPQKLEEAFGYLRSMASKSPVIADSILSTCRVLKGVDLDKLKP